MYRRIVERCSKAMIILGMAVAACAAIFADPSGDPPIVLLCACIGITFSGLPLMIFAGPLGWRLERFITTYFIEKREVKGQGSNVAMLTRLEAFAYHHHRHCWMANVVTPVIAMAAMKYFDLGSWVFCTLVGLSFVFAVEIHARRPNGDKFHKK